MMLTSTSPAPMMGGMVTGAPVMMGGALVGSPPPMAFQGAIVGSPPPQGFANYTVTGAMPASYPDFSSYIPSVNKSSSPKPQKKPLEEGVDTTRNQSGEVARLKTIGPPLDSKLSVTDRQTGETMAGVGIFFQQENESWIYVANIVPGSSADRCQLITSDDELIRVDNVEISPRESLEDVRTLILGPPGTYVTLFFRRPQPRGNGQVDYFYYDVELMRGSVDYINSTLQTMNQGSQGGSQQWSNQGSQQQYTAPPRQVRELPQRQYTEVDYSQYELEIARLRDEIDALRQQNAEIPDDPRVAPLQEELKARMEDLRRFEQMLQRSQERTKEAEQGTADTMRELDQVQEHNAHLVQRDRERAGSIEDIAKANADQIKALEKARREVEAELEGERNMRYSTENRLKEALEHLNMLRSEQHSKSQLETDVRSRLNQAHTAIADALQAQEAQLSNLADVIPQLDMVHSNLITTLYMDQGLTQNLVPPPVEVVQQPPMPVPMATNGPPIPMPMPMNGAHIPFEMMGGPIHLPPPVVEVGEPFVSSTQGMDPQVFQGQPQMMVLGQAPMVPQSGRASFREFVSTREEYA